MTGPFSESESEDRRRAQSSLVEGRRVTCRSADREEVAEWGGCCPLTPVTLPEEETPRTDSKNVKSLGFDYEIRFKLSIS